MMLYYNVICMHNVMEHIIVAPRPNTRSGATRPQHRLSRRGRKGQPRTRSIYTVRLHVARVPGSRNSEISLVRGKLTRQGYGQSPY